MGLISWAARRLCAVSAVFIATATLAGGPAFAQNAAAAAAFDGAAEPPVWRVTDEDSEAYLLGTFHILPPELDWRSPALATAIDAADTVWFEAEVDTPAAKQKTLQILMTQGFNPGGGRLTELLETGDADRLKTIVAELGLPLAAVDPMRPWQAFLTLSVQFIVKQGFDPGAGVETVLLNEARGRGRDLRFFETIDEQLGLFTQLPADVETELLVMTLREWNEQTEEFSTLFNAWRTGDIETIDTLMNDAMRDQAPEVFDALVSERNIKWTETIKKQMEGDGAFLVAVGAGHLAGDGSLPDLLAEAGYTVERLDAAAAPRDEPAGAIADDAAAGGEDAAGAETDTEPQSDAIGELLDELGASSMTDGSQ